MQFNNKKFLIFGMSKSGYSATQCLLNLGAKCFIFDEDEKKEYSKDLTFLIEKGAIKISIQNVYETLEKCDVLVISPGIAINHEVCIYAKKINKRIIGELELGSLLIKSPMIAVTGTNGKTTTVSMISKILEYANVNHSLVGNIGVPLTSKIDELQSFDNYAVTEISSFQLETIHSICPHIACILNITPDHLERHYTMENYIYLKGRLLKNMRESEYAILNADDVTVADFANNLRSKVLWFSKAKKLDAYYLEGNIYFREELIINEDDLSVKGEHNVYNVLASVCVAKILGIDNETIARALKEFKGAKHRIEYLGEINNKGFYNDSKGTNTGSTISAIKTMDKPTVLILGGKEKGESYEELFTYIKTSNVKKVVLCGESTLNMLKTAIYCGFTNICVEKDFRQAILLAEFLCKDGENVLLSPACSSFDSFTSYAERGEFFCKVVKEFDCQKDS